MTLSELTSREAVIEAMEEFDRLGREAFLQKYGFGEGRSYFVLWCGNRYDSKATAGVAHGYQQPHLGALRAEEFSGGVEGAAGVTSADAAFGPGGTIGCLLTTVSMLNACGSSTALGLGSVSTPAAVVESMVTTKLMAAIVRLREVVSFVPDLLNRLVDEGEAVSRALDFLQREWREAAGDEQWQLESPTN